MAIEESDREDLLREATRFSKRVLLALFDGESARMTVLPTPLAHDERQEIAMVQVHVFIGCRSNGAISVYWEAQPVFQFNEQGQLRRAYFSGNKYAAREGKLYRLDRERRGDQVQNLWSDITDEELRKLQQAWRSVLSSLLEVRDKLDCCIVGQVPPDDDLSWLRTWLGVAHPELTFSANPNA